MNSRESGSSCAVGWFLLALAIGSWLPRKGAGLYHVIATSDYPDLWRATILASGAALVIASYGAHPRVRALSDVLGIACWFWLATAFISADLWGATLQACVAICILNNCLFQLWRRR